jgi:hypothetical protein
MGIRDWVLEIREGGVALRFEERISIGWRPSAIPNTQYPISS